MKKSTNTIIADSSGVISLAVVDDSNHASALAAVEQMPPDGVSVAIPTEVLAETLNILGKKIGHAEAVEAIEILLESASFTVVPSSDVARLEALKVFRSVGPSVSYTDCLVMAMADMYRTKEIFGFDSAFARRGYTLPQGRSAAA